MDWFRRLNWGLIAIVVGPVLVVISIVAVRSRLWGPALEELRVLVREHDVILKEQNDRQLEILNRQDQLMKEVKSQREMSRCK
jgi:hypothetical protein